MITKMELQMKEAGYCAPLDLPGEFRYDPSIPCVYIERGPLASSILRALDKLKNLVDRACASFPQARFVILSESSLGPADLSSLLTQDANKEVVQARLKSLGANLSLPTCICIKQAAHEGHQAYLMAPQLDNAYVELELRENELGLSAVLKETELVTLDLFKDLGQKEIKLQWDLRPFRLDNADKTCGAALTQRDVETHCKAHGETHCEAWGETYNETHDASSQLVAHCYNKGFIERRLYWHDYEDKHLTSYELCAQALVYALRSYAETHSLKQFFVGLSGGMDSALVLALACAALGSDKIRAFMMPGPYSSELSYELAFQQVSSLGVSYERLDLEPSFKLLKSLLKVEDDSLAEQNLQARLRALYLMTRSNQSEASLVLNTGNKSEAALGYSTLYGDTIGALAPLADVYKTQVYPLAAALSSLMARAMIPEGIVTRAPSAELAKEQEDEKSLGISYENFDKLLESYLKLCFEFSKVQNPQEKVKAHTAIKEFLASTSKEERAFIKRFYAYRYKREQEPFGPTVSDTALAELELVKHPLSFPVSDLL